MISAHRACHRRGHRRGARRRRLGRRRGDARGDAAGLCGSRRAAGARRGGDWRAASRRARRRSSCGRRSSRRRAASTGIPRRRRRWSTRCARGARSPDVGFPLGRGRDCRRVPPPTPRRARAPTAGWACALLQRRPAASARGQRCTPPPTPAAAARAEARRRPSRLDGDLRIKEVGRCAVGPRAERDLHLGGRRRRPEQLIERRCGFHLVVRQWLLEAFLGALPPPP